MTTKTKAKKFRIKRSAPTSSAATPAQEPVPATAPGTTPRPASAGTARPQEAATGADQRPQQPQQTARAATAARPAPTQDAAQPHRVTPRAQAPQAHAVSSRAATGAASAAALQGEVASAHEAAGETDIDAIRREGLTGRQLRMARRVAQKHNLPATSDFDAVRLLRENGIDPFQRSNMLELVVPQLKRDQNPDDENPDTKQPKADRVQLPQTVPVQKQTLPSTDLSPVDRRNREISEIQRDIIRRRRRKMALLMARLAFFVFLPSLIAGFYFYVLATPMYATKSEFLILQADNSGGGAIGGLLSGTQFATNQDSIAVQSYLESKDAMLRLDRDLGFKAHFTQPEVDPIQRLEEGATNEEAYKVYRKNVKIGYDPTEGVIRMEVIAADPEVSALYSKRLISYAEDRVNHLTEQKRGDQMKDAVTVFENAQLERRKAQEDLVNLQQQGSVLDPEGVIVALRNQINTVEVQLQDKQLQLQALLDNIRPNQAKVDGVNADIGRLENLLVTLNERMTDASMGENSLAQLSVRIQMAQADLTTRDMMLQSALQQVEQTRMEANRQVRYLTISVEPVPPQEATYPKRFENTVLAFLIFSGIYLLFSLTASILREQVTS